jgi:phosphoribosylformimino-5-aminoimidazole carboxamide ribonucleotide (ProFAR) isomerase
VTFAIGLVGDIDADGFVNGSDLSVLLASWGQTAAASGFLAADLDGDGTVGGPDLAALLAAWGNGV